MVHPKQAEWRISNQAIAKILVTAILVLISIKLWPLLILFSLSLLLACSFYPAISFLEIRLPHWASAALVSIIVIAGLLGLVLGIVPTLVDQFSQIAKKLPEMQSTILNNFTQHTGRKALQKLFESPVISPNHVFTVGQIFLGTVSELALIVVLGLYLATDGKRTYQWLIAFFSPRHRAKIDATVREAYSIIVAYVIGQFITSILCALFTFTVLKVLHVPAALVLAVMAAIFDVLPMLGFFLFTIPAVLFAFTVSGQAALTVAIAYLAYHLIENYLLVPKIYGNRLRLSDLVVLVSVLAGAYLAGIPGAILSLPLVAIYPAIERIWLVEQVGREVVKKHDEVENSPAT